MGSLLSSFLIFVGVWFDAADFANTSFEDASGNSLLAYVAFPEDYDPNGSYPAAIVLHAWNGLSEEPLYFADLLAAEGYIAMAPDMYRGVAASSFNIPSNIFFLTTTPQAQINDDVDSAIQWLMDNTAADPSQIISGPGFCFGGTQSLILSARRPMFATVSLYGNLDNFQDPTADDSWGVLGTESLNILAIFGSVDRLVPVSAVRGFEAALQARNTSATVSIYEGSGHSFVNPEDHRSGMTNAVDAWNEITAYMQQVTSSEDNRVLIHDVKPLPSVNVHAVTWHVVFQHIMDFVRGTGHAAHWHDHGTASGAFTSMTVTTGQKSQQTMVQMLKDQALLDVSSPAGKHHLRL